MAKFLYIFCLVFFSVYLDAQVCSKVAIKDQNGNETVTVSCSHPLENGRLTLTAEAPQLRSTESYTVAPTTFAPPIPFNAGTPLNVNADDLFLPALPLPFNFCFFGKSYSKVVPGTNGVLTFDESLAGTPNLPNFNATNPDPELPLNSIFGLMHDIAFSTSDGSEIFWAVTGEEGCRKFILNFYEGRIVGCEERSSFQIVLHENTNIIEVFIDKKPQNCSSVRFPNSLIGIINETGSLGYSPSTRNTGVWTANDEAWVFSPETLVSPQFTWFNSRNEQIGTGQTFSVSPTTTETYTVKVNYPTCQNSQALTDEITITTAADYPLGKDASINLCSEGNNTAVNLQNYNLDLTDQDAANFRFRYYKTEAEALAGGVELSSNQMITSDAVFYARIENPLNPSCFSVAQLNLKLTGEELINNVIEICDQGNDGIESNVNLSQFKNLILPANFTGTVAFFSSQTDARANSNEVVTANISPASQFWVRTSKDGCVSILGPVQFSFKPTAEINEPLSVTLTMCDINFDGSEPFDWHAYFDSSVTSTPGVTISYHNTIEDARARRNPLTRIKGGVYQVFVAVELDGCITIGEIDVNVTFTGVDARNATKDICFDGTQDIPVNLGELSSAMLVNPLTGITITYHATQANAEAGISPIATSQTITDNGNLISKSYWVRFEQDATCYTVRQLTVRLVHPVAMRTDFDICDFLNDNSETITLSQFTNQIKGTQSASVTYFLTRSEAESNENSISQLTVTGPLQLFVRLESFGCAEIYPINIKLVPTPVIKPLIEKTIDDYCDNNADATEAFNLRVFESEIYSGSNVTFSYYLTYDEATRTLASPINPETFSATANSTVYVKVGFNTGGCFSVSTIKLKINFFPSINLQPATLTKCDTDFNANENFVLTDAIPQMFRSSDNVWPLSELNVTFYKSQQEANSGGSSGLISSASITTTASTVVVFARFQHKTQGCFSTAAVNLITILPPKVINSEITVCDNDLDGMYDVNLLNFTSQMVDAPDSNNVFTFYLNREDAVRGINAIGNPENFEVSPFPARIWVRAESLPGCYDVNFITFRFGTKTSVPQNQYILNDVCDAGNDRIETLDLTQFEEIDGAKYEYFASLTDLNNSTNHIVTPQAYRFVEASNPDKKIFVKVTDGLLCPALIQINIALKKAPVFELDEIYYFCPGDAVDIRPDFRNLNLVSYDWRDASGKTISTIPELTGINTEGRYTVTVTASDGCVHTGSFEVRQNEVPIITGITVVGNVYTVVASGSKTILYRANGGAWQSENIFPDLPIGVNTFYVRFADENCLGIPRQAVVLDIPNAITPNEDGLNDIWRINGLHVFDGQNSTIKVADRFGQIVFEQSSNSSFSWNGFYSSRPVPSGTYWYVITLPDGRQQTGWLVVKNRN